MSRAHAARTAPTYRSEEMGSPIRVHGRPNLSLVGGRTSPTSMCFRYHCYCMLKYWSRATLRFGSMRRCGFTHARLYCRPARPQFVRRPCTGRLGQILKCKSCSEYASIYLLNLTFWIRSPGAKSSSRSRSPPILSFLIVCESPALA